MVAELTVGMAVYDDWKGVWWTVQSLRMYHAKACRRCELVVVDNRPGSADSKNTNDFLSWVKGNDFVKARWVPLPSPIGTAAPRQRVFDVAEAPAVLCMDSHVQLWPGALERLLNYHETNQNGRDLLTGPMLYDDLDPVNQAAWFADVWRSRMHGVWERDARADGLDAAPFEVPANGLGVFSCRKEAWPGFNPRFVGFGGEEWYIHEKVRRNGGKCLCLPFLRWDHLFRRDNEPLKYPAVLRDTIRNYVIGHRELSLPLDRCRRHFCQEIEQRVASAEFDTIVAEADALTSAVFALPVPKATGGPGTELTKLLTGLGVAYTTSCDCRARAAQMDAWGVIGCRTNRNVIVGWLREGQGRWGWRDKLAAAIRVVGTGLAFRLNPLDPFPGLVDEAVRLADKGKPILSLPLEPEPQPLPHDPTKIVKGRVTVCMPTYNRVTHQGRCVDEAVESFLRQSHADKELVLLNDCPAQTLRFDHPQVKVVNLPRRCSSLARKRNIAVSHGTGDLLTCLDDDDVWLPCALQEMVSLLRDASFILFSGHWYAEGGRIVKLCGQHPNMMMCRRNLFEQLGGYREPLNAEVDQDFNSRVSAAKEHRVAVTERPFLIYRWGDGNFKLSGHAPKFPGDPTQWQATGERSVVQGTFDVRPVWLRDHVRDCLDYAKGAIK